MRQVPLTIHERERAGEREMFDRVRDRAYELFLLRGGEAGHEREDWRQAESEVLSGDDSGVTHTGRGYRLRCRLPGFQAEDVHVRAGEREIVVEAEKRGEGVGLVARNVYRQMKLAEPLDVEAVTADWDGSVLTVEASGSGGV